MSEGALYDLLVKRYPPEAWALVSQVRNGTGWARDPRTADALALGLWPSRGMELHGLEIKVSRSDWLRELKKPAKAEAIFAFCDRWWIVIADPAIVQAGELPPTWGLLVPVGGRLVVEQEAPKLVPKPPDVLMLAAILRRVATSTVPLASIADQIAKAKAEGIEIGKGEARVASSHLTELRERIAAFQKESGVNLDHWSYGNIGRAVKDVITFGPEQTRRNIEGHLAWAKRIVEDCEKQLRAPEDGQDH